MPVRIVLCILISFLTLCAQSDWDEPFPPHRIADNVYYVGSRGLASYLITSKDGHILINSSFDRTVPLIRASVEKLGFQFKDIKVLLGSHAHSDHVAGNALVQELTGAQIHAMRGDDTVIASGGKGQYLYDHTWKPATVHKVLRNGDKVALGGNTLTAHLTPGHTRGCTTWTMDATDQGKTYTLVIVGSPNVNPGFQLVNNADYPAIAEAFARTLRGLKALQTDLFLGAHGNYYGMEAKHRKLEQNGTENPFVDPEGYKAYIADREAHYLKVLS